MTKKSELALGAPPLRWERRAAMPAASPSLRWGFSTGACVAALLLASVKGLKFPASVPVLFGDGVARSIPLEPEAASRPGFCRIQKNGGDDPDCTDGAMMYGRLKTFEGSPMPEDVELRVGSARVFLRGIFGVGVARRAGLDCETGRFAVSLGARRIIGANLERAGLTEGVYLGEIGVEGGEELARHTLNPRLGVEGGISILGTSGLVRPYSAAAYVDCIHVHARALAREGAKSVVLCTGGRSEALARSWLKESEGKRSFGDIAGGSFICIADFIADSLHAAKEAGMERVLVACMPGKLLKYSTGLKNTHAANSAQDMDALLAALQACGIEPPLKAPLPPTMREALELLPQEGLAPLFALLAKKALASFFKHMGGQGPAVSILLLGFDGKVLGFYG